MTIPAHVPAELVYSYNFFTDPELLQDPHKRMRALTEKFPGGIFYTPECGGHWVVTGYEQLTEIARDAELFSSKHTTIPRRPVEFKLIPINIDPPDHAKYRRVIASAFSPRLIRTMEEATRKFVNELIDQVVDNRGCEFVHAIAEPLPITVFMKLVGLPLERMPEFRDWASTALTSTDMNERMATIQKIVIFITETILDLQQKPVSEDLLSVLSHSEVDGRPLTLEELQAYGLLLMLAGLDTVVNGMAFGIRHLAQHPELQAEIRTNPACVPAVVEEMLRRYSFPNTVRSLTRDADFHGLTMKEGDMVMLVLGAADLDEKAYENAEAFDMNRKGPRHVAFNTGPHNCAGASLARMELGLLYEEWCRRIPEFHLDETKPATFCGGPVIGVKELHILW